MAGGVNHNRTRFAMRLESSHFLFDHRAGNAIVRKAGRCITEIVAQGFYVGCRYLAADLILGAQHLQRELHVFDSGARHFLGALVIDPMPVDGDQNRRE
jgi:hypothetical protein